MVGRVKNISVRLSAIDTATVKRELTKLGKDGQSALKKIETASKTPSRGLLAINAASAKLKGTFTSLAASGGLVAAGLAKMGVAGAAAAAAVGGAFLAVRSLVPAVKNALQGFEDLAQTANKLGTGTEFLQELRFAAEQVNIPINTLEMGLQRVGRRIGEVAEFGKGEGKVAIDALGLSIFDANGNLKDLEQILPEIADGLAKVTDPFRRNALAMKLFDSEAVVMVNLLGEGAAKLNALRAEARAAGAVIDDSLVQSGARLNSQLGAINRVISQNLNSAFLALGPILVEISGLFAEIARAVAEIVDAFRDIESISTRGLQSRLVEAREAERLARERVEEGGPGDTRARTPLLRAVDPTGQVGGIIEDLGQGLGILPSPEEQLDQARVLVDRIEAELASRELEIPVRVGAPILGVGETAALNDPILKAIEALKAETAALGPNTLEHQKAIAVAKIEVIARTAQKELTDDQVAAIEREIEIQGRRKEITQQVANLAKAEVAQRTAALKLIEDTRTAEEKLVLEKERIRDLTAELTEILGDEAEAQETVNRALAQAETASKKVALETANVAGEVESLTRDALAGNIQAWDDLSTAASAVLQRMLQELILAKLGVDELSSALSGLGGGGGGSLFGAAASFLGGAFGGAGGGAGGGGTLPPGAGSGSAAGPGGGFFLSRGAAIEDGRLLPMGRGSVLTRPRIFPLQRGRALAAEAGPEGVLPLARLGDGDLGVKTTGDTMSPLILDLLRRNTQAVEALGAGGGAGGAEIKIELINQTSEPVRARGQFNPGTREARIFIESAVVDSIRNDGPVLTAIVDNVEGARPRAI